MDTTSFPVLCTTLFPSITQPLVFYLEILSIDTIDTIVSEFFFSCGNGNAGILQPLMTAP